MTSFDIIDGLFRGEDGQVGLYENIWPDTLRLWTGQGYPTDPDGQPADPVDVFGLDLGRLGGAFDAAPWPGQRVVLEQSEEYEIVWNSAGVKEKIWRKKSAPAGHIAYRLTGPDIWAREYKPIFLSPDPSRVPAEKINAALMRHRSAGRWVCYNMSFVWENFRQTVGDICMYESLVEDPGWIEDYNRTMLDFYIRHFDMAFEAAGMPEGVWFSEDLAYNQGLFCSPRILKQLIFPFYRAMNDYLHGKGLKVILHSCGNITEALPLIVDAGFDALHPMQVRAGCDPLKIAREYGEKLVLLGGLDTHLLERGDEKEIREAQTRLILGMQDAGARYIFSSDHSISTNVSYETYRRVLDIYHRHSGRSS